jgi:glycosyltransferase involved in cell wall biosynthesis
MKGRVAKAHIPFVLSTSSVNLLNYSQTQYNWTRGNSSNKLFEYMASGKPIISTVKMGYCPLERYNCGISIEPSTPEELAKAVVSVKNMPVREYEAMGQNAREGAKDFDFEVLTSRLVKVIDAEMR